jgi:HTH-type transcriptional regulator/antitoxin HigA
MKTKNIKNRAADDYLDLVKRFPLRPIRSEDQYDQAVEIVGALIGLADHPGLTAGQSDYADALGAFVRTYDVEHYPIQHTLKTPIERLKYLMEQSGMNTSQLGELLGSGSGQASLILRGKRELSKANIRVLAEKFHVNPGLFI